MFQRNDAHPLLDVHLGFDALGEGGRVPRGGRIHQREEGVLAERDPDAGFGLVNKLPTRNLRWGPLQQVFTQWAEPDPAAAAAKLIEIEPERLRRNFTGVIATQWADRDPEAAKAWALNLPEGDSRRQFLGTVASQWAANEPQNALAWAARLPDGEDKRRVYGNIASSWADSISDEAVRFNQMETAARNSLMLDRPTAERWVNASTLPEECKKMLLDTVR